MKTSLTSVKSESGAATTVELPSQVQLALQGLHLSKAQPNWVELLLVNGGDDEERWGVIAKAVLALKTFQQYPHRPIEGWLAEYEIPFNHRLIALAHSTVALFDEKLFPNVSFAVAGF